MSENLASEEALQPAPEYAATISSAGALALEAYDERPEIVNRLGVLSSDDYIVSEQASLQRQIDFEDANGTGDSRYASQLRTKLDMQRTGEYGRLAIDQDDSRTAGLQSLILAGPKLTRKTWLGSVKPPEGASGVCIDATAEQPVLIPTSNIVGIESFDSWRGRGDTGPFAASSRPNEKAGRDDGIVRSSEETIDMYAKMDTPIPPIDTASGYVQPNGIIIFVAEAGAHRTAAALERGDELLAVKQLILTPIQENYIQADEAAA